MTGKGCASVLRWIGRIGIRPQKLDLIYLTQYSLRFTLFHTFTSYFQYKYRDDLALYKFKYNEHNLTYKESLFQIISSNLSREKTTRII